VVCLSYRDVLSIVGTVKGQICHCKQAQCGYHRPSLLVEVDIEVFIQLFDLFGLHPLLRIRELADRTVNIELSRSQIPSISISMCYLGMETQTRTVVFHHRG
jgi:hypothetical protein